MSTHENMLAVLSALMSNDNEQRKQAEAYFSSALDADCGDVISTLCTIFSTTDGDMLIRSFAGVLLRRAVEKSDIPAEMNAQFRASLMSMWKDESDTTLLKRLAHTMAQSAMKESWLDLLPQVVQNASENSDSIPSALSLVEVIAEYCPTDILTHIQILGGFLSSNLGSDDLAVQVACSKGICACIRSLENEDQARDAFKPAIEPIVNVMGSALSNGDEQDASAIMEYLCDIALRQPIFYKNSMDHLVSACITIAQSSELEFTTRTMALEVIVTLAETAPALARRCTVLAPSVVPLCFSMMLEVEESEEEWSSGAYGQESDDVDYYTGEDALERIIAGMGGRTIAPLVLEIVQTYSQAQSWQEKRAAVAGLSRLAAGCEKSYKPNYDTGLEFLASLLQDGSVRVQFQVIETLGNLAALFPKKTSILVDNFLSPLTEVLGQSAMCDKVRGECANTLIHLTNPEYCEVEHLEPHLESVLAALVNCLTNGISVEIQPVLLDLLGCVAAVSEEKFTPYYSSFMPGIVDILKSTSGNSPELIKVRGKAMDCIGLLGEAVGAEEFYNDATEVMQILLTCMQTDSDNDVNFDYILPACARISKTLQQNFEPYIDMVMRPLIQGASRNVDCSIEDALDNDVEGEVHEDEETGLQSAVVSLGAGQKKRITLNTHAVHQRSQAARMLYEFASSLKGHLKQYLLPSIEACINMITDKHSNETRSSASLALPKVFGACVDGVKIGHLDINNLTDILNASMQKLLEAVNGEINPTARVCACESLFEVLTACYESGEEQVNGYRSDAIIKPTLEVSQELMLQILNACAASVKRSTDREQSFNANEGYEGEDKAGFSEEEEEEEETLANLCNAIGLIIKLNANDATLPALMQTFHDNVAPVFMQYMSSNNEHFQIVSCCMMDDAIEFGYPDAAQAYIPEVLPTFLQNISTSENEIVRQSSSYGIAQIIAKFPTVFLQFPQAQECIQGLINLVNLPQARDEDNIGATENALWALGNVLTMSEYNSIMDVSGFAPVFLAGMPLKEDEFLTKNASLSLVTALESKQEPLLGDLNVLLRVCSDILISTTRRVDDDHYHFAHPDVTNRLIAVVKSIGDGSYGFPEEAVKAAFESLSENQHSVIASVCA